MGHQEKTVKLEVDRDDLALSNLWGRAETEGKAWSTMGENVADAAKEEVQESLLQPLPTAHSAHQEKTVKLEVDRDDMALSNLWSLAETEGKAWNTMGENVADAAKEEVQESLLHPLPTAHSAQEEELELNWTTFGFDMLEEDGPPQYQVERTIRSPLGKVE